MVEKELCEYLVFGHFRKMVKIELLGIVELKLVWFVFSKKKKELMLFHRKKFHKDLSFKKNGLSITLT